MSHRTIGVCNPILTRTSTRGGDLVMGDVISDQHGAEAVRKRLTLVDPKGSTAYAKFFGPPSATREGTALKLIEGHNEIFQPNGIADDVADLKRELNRRPF